MMLVVKNLSKSFGDRTVLSDLTINFEDKGVYIIVGMNGCGKTTFMNLLTHLSKAEDGLIMCYGHALGSKAYKSSIFYIPSDFYLPEYLTAKEYLNLILSYYPNADVNVVDFLLDVLDLKQHEQELLESFSFGMKKKIQLVAALAANTPYVLADELFSGLDFDTVLIVQELLTILQEKRCFILVSHDLKTLLTFPDNIYMMRCGQLNKFCDKPELIANHVKEMGDINDKIRQINQHFNTSKILS